MADLYLVAYTGEKGLINKGRYSVADPNRPDLYQFAGTETE